MISNEKISKIFKEIISLENLVRKNFLTDNNVILALSKDLVTKKINKNTSYIINKSTGKILAELDTVENNIFKKLQQSKNLRQILGCEGKDKKKAILFLEALWEEKCISFSFS